MRIAVGWNGSPESEDALTLGAQLADALEARLLLTEVVGAHADEASPEPGFDRARSMLAGLAPEVPVTGRRVTAPGPASGLRRALSEADASALAVGSTHRGALGRVLPGTTADHLIPGAPCPVAIAPRGYASGSYRPLRLVGLAYDGSDHARRAATVAAALARRGSTGLRVFGVVEPPPVGELGPSLADTGHLGPTFTDQALGEELDELLAGLPPQVAGQKVLLHGEPAAALLAQGRHAIDLLVAGTSGHRALAGSLLGSVTRQLGRSASWPVLVVGPEARLERFVRICELRGAPARHPAGSAPA